MRILLVFLFVAAAVVQGDPARYLRRFPSAKASRRPMDSVALPLTDSGKVKTGSAKIGGRIIGGSPASEGQFPWQAAVRLDGRAFCGGSLITENCVLTAAHCADGITSFAITLGTLSSANNPEGALTLTSTHAVVHPSYWSDGSTTDNDVAIVHLSEVVTPTDVISTIRLPSASQVGETFAGSTATLSGWGLVSDDAETVSPTLQFVAMTIITNDQCEESYPGAISIDHVCTLGTSNESSCNGDSGGPLVVQEEDGQWTEVGVVSFGSDFGCTLGYPSAFARVTTYLDWINENLIM